MKKTDDVLALPTGLRDGLVAVRTDPRCFHVFDPCTAMLASNSHTNDACSPALFPRSLTARLIGERGGWFTLCAPCLGSCNVCIRSRGATRGVAGGEFPACLRSPPNSSRAAAISFDKSSSSCLTFPVSFTLTTETINEKESEQRRANLVSQRCADCEESRPH